MLENGSVLRRRRARSSDDCCSDFCVLLLGPWPRRGHVPPRRLLGLGTWSVRPILCPSRMLNVVHDDPNNKGASAICAYRPAMAFDLGSIESGAGYGTPPQTRGILRRLFAGGMASALPFLPSIPFRQPNGSSSHTPMTRMLGLSLTTARIIRCSISFRVSPGNAREYWCSFERAINTRSGESKALSRSQ